MKARAWLLALGASLALSSAALPQARPPSQRSGPITVYGPITSDDKITGNSMQAGQITAQTLTSGTVNLTADGSSGPADGLSVARSGGAQIRRALKGLISDLPLPLTSYGAVSGQDSTAALQAALNDCGDTGRPVFAPAGTYIFSGTSNFPVASGKECPGIYGESDKTIFAVVNYNGPVIRAFLPSGRTINGVTIANINTQGQWASASSPWNNTSLIEITGGQGLQPGGWAYSRFYNLGGYAIDHIVKIDSEYAVVSGDGKESHSGWNEFKGLYGGTGSQGFQVKDFVLHTKGSSTGSSFHEFHGNPSRSFLRYEGDGYVVGDIVVTGGQSGNGRVISIGANTTYNRNIVVNGTQVDASSIEVIQWDGGNIPPSRLKLTGSFGGTNPWAGIPPVAHSAIHGLGESIWSEGGIIANYGGTANGDGSTSHVIPLWTVTLSPSTMTRIEVSVTGEVGNVDTGGIVQTNDLACSPSAVGKTVSVGGNQLTATLVTPPAGWVALIVEPYTEGGNCQFRVSTSWTDKGQSKLATNITAKHGRFKLNRVISSVPF